MRIFAYFGSGLQRHVCLLVLVLVAFMFTSCSAEPPRPKDYLVFAFGDSLTEGYGLKPSESFPAQLEQLLRDEGLEVRVHNAGISGDTTAGGKARLARTLDGLDRKPDLAILELGANDMLMGRSPAAAEANLDAMLTEFSNRGIPVVLAGMFEPVNLGIAYFDQYNAIYPRLAKKHDVTLYPFFMRGVIATSPLLLDDGVHPNADGARVIAENILPVVRAELLDLPAPGATPTAVPQGATRASPVRSH